MQIVWAKAGYAIWDDFDGKLYFTKDIVDDSFAPRNRKPKPIPKTEAKPAPKPALKGKHVQLFKMRRKVLKGFYSTAVDACVGSEDLQNMLKFACCPRPNPEREMPSECVMQCDET